MSKSTKLYIVKNKPVLYMVAMYGLCYNILDPGNQGTIKQEVINMKTYEEIKSIYIKRYPHLSWLKTDKAFANAALMLESPAGISLSDLWNLATIANK